MNGEGKVVCVTGASGYVASYLVKLLLERGYTVKATVRNLSDPRKVDHLKALEGADERLKLFEADLLKDGSFDSAIDGCEGVFHTASPVLFTPADPQADVIEPAVKGTLNVLKSCSKAPTVKRVVLTSSVASVLFNRNAKGPDVELDESWFSDKVFCEEIKQWYPLAKTMAEEAAWKFAEENGIDLVVMNPGLVIGPLLQPTLNTTTDFFLHSIIGDEVLFPTKEIPLFYIVDIRDVAYAHILGFENPTASGRYCLVGTILTKSEIQHALHKLYPSICVPSTATENPTHHKVSKKKAESLGINFTPLEISLKDTIENLKENNSLNL